MDCQQTNNLLSHYFDGELPEVQRMEVESHFGDCSRCLQELAFFRKLSTAIRRLSVPAMPREMLWQRITAELDQASRKSSPTVLPIICAGSLKARKWAFLSTAAIVMMAISIAFVIYNTRRHHGELQRYATLLESEPRAAQLYLAKQFSGQTVSADEAIRLVGYRPRNVQPPPAEFICDELVVLDMPCCKCVQAIWSRPDRSTIAVFEHQSEMDDWFSSDSSIRMKCAGIECRLTQLDGQLAATWQVGSRVITVIGLKDANELSVLVQFLS
jgi:hypothetical protein